MFCRDWDAHATAPTGGDTWSILLSRRGMDDEDRLRSGKIFKVGFRSTFVQIGPDRSHTKFQLRVQSFDVSQSAFPVTATITAACTSPQSSDGVEVLTRSACNYAQLTSQAYEKESCSKLGASGCCKCWGILRAARTGGSFLKSAYTKVCKFVYY
jgi:hypothetical protein